MLNAASITLAINNTLALNGNKKSFKFDPTLYQNDGTKINLTQINSNLSKINRISLPISISDKVRVTVDCTVIGMRVSIGPKNSLISNSTENNDFSQYIFDR